MPILEALIEMGGRGKVGEVLNKVFEKMKDKLTPKDLELLPSGREKRWTNHARWESFTLANEGYIRKSKGIWEITDKGIKYCEEQKAGLQLK
jgi:restriction endonuclease Mrr